MNAREKVQASRVVVTKPLRRSEPTVPSVLTKVKNPPFLSSRDFARKSASDFNVAMARSGNCRYSLVGTYPTLPPLPALAVLPPLPPPASAPPLPPPASAPPLPPPATPPALPPAPPAPVPPPFPRGLMIAGAELEPVVFAQ